MLNCTCGKPQHLDGYVWHVFDLPIGAYFRHGYGPVVCLSRKDDMRLEDLGKRSVIAIEHGTNAEHHFMPMDIVVALSSAELTALGLR